MNPLKQLAIFTRDLLTHNEQLIRIGRQNFERAQLEANYIVIDGLGASVAISRSEEFDGNTEEQSFGSQMLKPCTIDFYGADAFINANKFRMMLRSQLSYELQTSLKIGVYGASTVTDVKALTGQAYGNRVQLEINLQYCDTLTIDTLRIDVAQISIIKDN